MRRNSEARNKPPNFRSPNLKLTQPEQPTNPGNPSKKPSFSLEVAKPTKPLMKLGSPESYVESLKLSSIPSSSAVSFVNLEDGLESSRHQNTFSKETASNLVTENNKLKSKISVLESKIDKINHSHAIQVNYMQEYINFLKKKLGMSTRSTENLDIEFTSKFGQMNSTKKLTEEIDHLNELLYKKDTEVFTYLDEIVEKEEQITYLTNRLSIAEGNSETYRKSNLDKEETVRFKKEIKEYYEKQIADLEHNIVRNKVLMENKNEEIKELKQEIVKCRVCIENKDKEIDYLANQSKKYESECIERSMNNIARILKETINKSIDKYDKELKNILDRTIDTEYKVSSLMKAVKFLNKPVIRSYKSIPSSSVSKINFKFEDIPTSKNFQENSNIKEFEYSKTFENFNSELTDEKNRLKVKDSNMKKFYTQTFDTLNVSEDFYEHIPPSPRDLLDMNLNLELRQSLAEKTKKIDKLNKIVSDYQGKIRNSIETLQLSDKESSIIKNELETVKSALEKQKNFDLAIKQLNEEYMDQLKSSEKKISDQFTIISNLEDNIKVLNQEKSNQLDTINNLKTIIKEEKEKHKANIIDLKKYKSELDKLQNHNFNISDSFKSLRETQAAEKEKYDRIISEKQDAYEKVTLEKEKLKVLVRSFEEELEVLKQRDFENTQSLPHNSSQILEELRTYKINEKKIKIENNELLAHNSQLKQDVEFLDQQIAKVSEENSTLKLKLEEVSTDALISNTKNATIIKELEEIIQDLNIQVEENRKKVEECKSILETKENEISILRNNLEEFKSENFELFGYNNERIKTLHEKEKSIYQIKVTLNDEINDLKFKIKEKESELLLKTQTIYDLQTINSKITEKHKKDKENLLIKENYILELDQQIKTMHDDILNYIETESNLKKIIEQDKLEKIEKSDLIDELKNNCSSLQNKVNDLHASMEKAIEEHRQYLISSNSSKLADSKLIKDYENQIQAYSQEIAIVKSKLNEYEKKFSLINTEQSTKSQSYKEKQIDLEFENSQLKQKNRNLDLTIIKLSEEKSSLVSQIEDEKNSNKIITNKLELQIKELLTDKNDLIDNVNTLRSSLEAAEENINYLTQNNQSEASKLMLEIENYRKTIQTLTLEKNELELKSQILNQKVTSTDQKVNEELKSVKKTLKEKETELELIRESRNSLEAQNKKLIENKKTIEESLLEKINENKDIGNKYRAYQEEKHNLLETIRKLNYSVEDINNKLIISHSNINQLEQELINSRNSLDTLKQNYTKEIDDITEKLLERDAKIANLLIENENNENTQKKQAKEITSLQLEVKNFENSNKDSKNLYEEISRELADHQAREEDMRKEILFIYNGNKELKITINKLNEEIFLLSDENKMLKQRETNLSGEVSLLSEENKKLKKKLDDFEAQDYTNENTSLKSEQEKNTFDQKFFAEIEDLKGIIEDLKVTVENLQQEKKIIIEDHYEKLDQLKKNYENQILKTEELEKTRESLEKELQQQYAINKPSEIQINLMEKQNQEILQKNKLLEKDIIEKDLEIQELHNTISSKNCSIKVDQKVIQNLKKTVEESKKIIDDLNYSITENNRRVSIDTGKNFCLGICSKFLLSIQNN